MKTFDISWECSARIFRGVVFPLSLLLLLTVIFSVTAGAGYNDEAWLVLMVQNQTTGFWTSFAKYYRFMLEWGLSEMRLTVALLHGLACALFVWGVIAHYRPFEKHVLLNGVLLWAVTALLPQVFWLGGMVLAPDYKFVAYDCALAGTGFFFLGLHRSFLLLLSGACFIQILFVLPPAGLLAPLLLLILLLDSWKKLLIFLAGGVIGAGIFFFGLSSWSDFLSCLSYSGTRIAANAPGRHGISMLIAGYCKIASAFAAEFLPPALLLFAARKVADSRLRHGIIGAAVLLLLVTFALGTLRVLSWKSAGCPGCDLAFVLILFCYLWFCELWESGSLRSAENWRNILLASLFLVMPVVFCTGTDKGFENRFTFYAGTTFAGIVVFAWLRRDKLLLNLLSLFLVLSFLGGLVYWKQSCNFQLRPRTFSALQAGFPTDARITPDMAEHLKQLAPYVAGAKVVVNDPLHWYVPYLFQKPMLHLTSFRYYSFDDISAMLKARELKAKDVVFLEDPEYALPPEQLENCRKVLHASRVERTVLSESHHILRFTE